ncbi:hypothetical protein G6N05_14100 [Flavobacterium sp. F372]|uniref:DUF3244 domain-containing protein n=1 Tax=Flavobacterium bernardetii TaxID=2813823 RepID=A0ABR7J205_9FLAO|nr:hypothetical protein [Flavobacterium bernardetii]MBC5836017.1 hypothetical protein [Flavobacterium bernardetii]NHF71243.1 hypothetical protein [Flavobacterium bernardetii]
MKFHLIILFTILSFQYSISQVHEELGVKFTLKDSEVIVENIDKKFKEFKIIEIDTTSFTIIELSINYQIEGSFVKSHILYTKNGNVVIEIISDKLKKKIIFKRK